MSEKHYMTVEGTAAFVYLTEPDSYMGNSKYSVTLNLDDDSAKALSDMGVKVKDYEKDGITLKQREFKRKSEYGVPLIFNKDGDPIGPDAISWGDTLRLAITVGGGNALGRGTYLGKVKLLEKNPEAKESAAADNAGDF